MSAESPVREFAERVVALLQDRRAGMNADVPWSDGYRTGISDACAIINKQTGPLTAGSDLLSVPVDVVRLAAQYTGELAESLVKNGESARGGHVDIFAEHLQQEADGEPVDWTTVLSEHAARELKLQGPEPGA